VPVPDYTPRGHQFMPSLTFGQGRLVLTYYDTRFDHTQRLYKPRPPPWETTPLFDEQVALVGDLLTQSANAPPSYTRDSLPYVFNEWITDVNLAQVRHTVEVRVAATVPGPSPRFATSQRVSRFDYGARRDGNDLRYGSGEGELWLQQLQFNPPNLPIFAGGTRAFLGDYIDVQGPAFTPKKGGSGWEFNFAPTSAPVFHAVWTSNQDVRVPFVPTFDSEGKETGYEVDWTQYTPVGLGAGRTSTFDPAQTCAACVAATAGSRDQNIYTSRITEGLRVAAPQNAKPLSAAMTRAFVVTAENDTSTAMTVTFTASTAASGVGFSFVNERFGASAVTSLTATIPPRSGVARSLFAKLTDASASPSATLAVTVDETGCTSPCRSGSVTLNPPVALASLVTPDGSSTDPNAGEAYDPNMGSGVVTAPAILGPAILGPAILGPAILGPAILGESIASPAILGPAILGPAILGPAILGPAILGDSIASPAILGPAILGPAILGPAILGDGIASPAILGDSLISTSLADVTYMVKNQGNTTASYHLQFVASQEERESLPPMQLIVTRTYETPVASGCELKTQARNQLVATTAIDPRTSSAFVSPSEAVDPKVEQGSPDNLSFAVAPGAELAITARVNLLADLGRPPGPDPLTLVATKVRPFVVASSVTPGSSGTYETPSTPGGIGAGASLTSPPYLTRTGLTSSPGLLSVRVARTRADGSLVYPAMPSCAGCHDRHAPSLPNLLLPEILAQIAVEGPVFPVGTVELLRVAPNGSVLTSLGAKALDSHGGATLTTSVVLAAGETVVAVFRGSAQFAPSRSLPLLATAMSLTTDVNPWSPQVTFMASLTTFGSSPTGTVTFRDGAAALAAVPLACTADLLVSPVRYDCQASFRTTLPLAPGPRSVTATYPGDGNHESSTSNAVAWTMPPYQVLQQTAMELGSFPMLGDTSPGVNQRFGQVVPGSAGRIAGIRVPVYCSPGATLKLEFKVVTDYKPDDRFDVAPAKLIENANGLLPVMYPSLDQFTMILFDTPVVVAPTDPQAIWGSFAIVLSATGYCTLAQGPAGDPYPGFGAFFFNSAIGEWRAMAEERDLPFQIFMQLVQ
jgi:Bacterial Ig-like domain (group 3)